MENMVARHYSHLNTAAAILESYRGDQPFHLFIKEYFRQDKKYGSRDRKSISHLCYAFFRLGPSFENMPVQDKILLGVWLCATQPEDLLEALRPEWNAAAALPPEEKCRIAGISPLALSCFPFPDELSETVDKNAFSLSHLKQPDLFVRIRPGQEKNILAKLDKAGLSYTRINDTCIAFPNATKTEELFTIDKEAVIQDYSSQRVGDFLRLAAGHISTQPQVWDCCAASGGKSILAKDILGDIKLTVSDVRSQILQNLIKRFAVAGIAHYQSLLLDLTKSTGASQLPVGGFDLIIADAPCSGSGTWGRTPESLTSFKKTDIQRYQSLQQKVVSAAFPHLRSGGCFLYITCSVFKKENEDIVSFIQQQFNPRLLKMELLEGYRQKADTLFAALFVKE